MVTSPEYPGVTEFCIIDVAAPTEATPGVEDAAEEEC